MILSDQATHYEVLEISPQATLPEIREAYQRVKTAYRRDSLALYSLMDASETEAILRRIEEAYQVLSSAERRKEYDKTGEQVSTLSSEDVTGVNILSGGIPEESPFESTSEDLASIVSIDRVPPMERGSDSTLLVPPTTDFTAHISHSAEESPSEPLQEKKPLPAAPYLTSPRNDFHPLRMPQPVVNTMGHLERRSSGGRRRGDELLAPGVAAGLGMSGPRELSRELKDEIDRETQWSGFFLKKIREARGVSLEEMSQLTKISRTYLQCIEIEDAQRLPAQVFLRGFLTQYCKTLKLPVDQVLPIYLERIRKKIKP